MSGIRGIGNFLGELIGGCSHRHLTRPFTLDHRSYKVCLDCGKELPYSIEQMRAVPAWELARPHAEIAELLPVTVAPSSVFKVATISSGRDQKEDRAIA
jgi:hypothetical protein